MRSERPWGRIGTYMISCSTARATLWSTVSISIQAVDIRVCADRDLQL
jgi:hypothetical protein